MQFSRKHLTKYTSLLGFVLVLFTGLSANGQQSVTDKKILSIERNKTDQTPTSIRFTENAGWKEEQAQELFARYLGADGVNNKMQLTSTTKTKQGIVAKRYYQYYKEIKTEYGSFTLSCKNGTVAFMTGNYYTFANNPSATPVISERDAFAKALKKVGAQLYKWDIPSEEAMIKQRYGKPDTTYKPAGKLAWIEDYQNGIGDRIAHLAWSFDIYAHEPLSRQKVFVDAVTGKILYSNPMIRHTAATGRSRYSGTVSFQSANTGPTYVLYDSTRGNGVHTLDMHNGTSYGASTDITSNTNTWPITTRDSVAIDAHWAGAAVYDYWLTVQGRHSWDDLDGILLQYIHYSNNFNNAFWDGTEMTYGDGSGCSSGFTPLMSLDVTAHEIGHGVCEATCNLIYESEPGAINEAFSDCWGATIENYANPLETDAVTKRIWEIGEEIDCGTPLRRMDFPKLRGQPDTWHGVNWFSVIACTPTGGNDQCGVHNNSGVMNKWYYLITNGGSGTNDIGSTYSVTGLGFADAGNILYQTELVLSSTSDYPALRTASINTTILLYGLCSPQEVAVTNAWYAVGIGAAYISPVSDIVGTPRMCVGASVTLTDPMPGGTWFSGNLAVATIGSVSGVVTGVSAGTSLITYTISTGCSAVKVATINPLPGAFSGSLNACLGRANTLTNAITGGTWSSSLPGVATIGSTSGVVNGVSLGTSTIDYVLPTGCSATVEITVNPTPGAITGAASVCVGAVTTEANAMPGGAWSSGNLAVATIDASSGDITGVSAGTTTISYAMPSGCMATRVITVNITPAGIAGSLNVCVGATTALTDATGGGAWSSQFTGIATVGAGTGIATGVSVGVTNISYIMPTGCYAIATLNVNPTPGPITGATAVCQGATVGLGNSVPGGTWTSSATTIASIDVTTGAATGLLPGTTTIVYSLGTGCSVSRTLSVNLTPAAISGASLQCIGFTTTLTDATPGGAWTSGNTAIATVGSATGIVTGITPGGTAISYTLPTGCYAALPFTVTPLPSAISGPATLCEGSAATMSNTVPGGTWSSSIPGVASVGLSTGIATGVLAGITTISYTIAAGCYTTANVTVLSAPSAITGSSLVCITATTTLSNAVPGGTWTSSAPAIAPVTPGSGVISGLALGTATITYSLATGCIATTIINVTSATTAPIVGAVALCEGLTLPFTDASPGGTWSSSAPTVASVTLLTGAVTGNTPGTATITYTLATPCGIATATQNITVNPTPTVSPITGTFTVCPGLTTTLANATPGGTWSSSDITLATVSGGLVTGVALGTPTISYTVTNAFACQESAYVPVSVSVPFTPVITPSGTVTICTGATAPLSATTGVGYTYQWKKAGVNIPGATSATYMTTTPGVYTIEERAPSGCAATSAAVTVVVNPAPVVTPSVFILASPDTMLCIAASPVTFNAIPVNGGSSPALMWYVNGALVYTGLTFVYTPANGDVVKCKMVSSNICAMPDTATDQRHMVISPMRTPALAVIAAPGTTVCNGGTVLLTANPTYGGSAPTYTWNKNGVAIATGPSLSYTPAEGDRVYCTMNSNAGCLTTNIATSPTATLHLAPASANSLAITVSQSSIVSGQVDTFRAYCTHPGSAPSYQWYINGAPVTGATNSVFITATLTHGQVVNCQVISSDPCTAPRTIYSTGITINVSPAGILTSGTSADVTLQPNPNNGEFRLYGKLWTNNDGSVTLMVTNMVGQTIYSAKIKTTNGKIDEQIKLGDNLANGLYILTLSSGNEQSVYRFVVGK